MESLAAVAWPFLGLLIGIIGTFLSPFGLLFVAATIGVFVLAWRGSTKKVAQAVAEWTTGVYLLVFWILHWISNGPAAMATFPCGVMMADACPVMGSGGFPFTALHSFPAGDTPYTSMWPLFFLNVLIFGFVALLISRFAPERWMAKQWKWGRIVLILGIVATLIGEGLIMLRYD